MPDDFDVNAPEGLNDFVPDIDPDARPEQIRQAPPQDGVHWAVARPNTKREGGPVYYKDIVRNADGRVVDGKVIAALSVRVLNEDGTEGAFLKDLYASTTPMGPRKGSSLTWVLGQAKTTHRLASRSGLETIKNHAEAVLAETAEEGIRLLVKTRWVKSVPQAKEENGLVTYVFDEKGMKVYSEVKGEDKIKALAVQQAEQEVLFWVAEEDESAEDFEFRKQEHISTAPDRAHLWWDPVTSEERSAQAEIQSLEDPRLYVTA